MYRKIFTAIDNSPYSEGCSAAAVSVAQAFGGEVVGSHVYAAGMHERRFRQLEATLPEEYLEEEELERQRAIHDSLISLGLRLISDSYLDILERRCREAEVPFRRKTFDGRNWERLVEEINGSEYDLVVMGARGHGESRGDSVGSVALRVLRRTRTDTLVVKDMEAFRNGVGRRIVVGVDGSREAFGALQGALAMGKAYGKAVEAVAAYDPYFHYRVFSSMVEALSEEAARLFRFKEQERLHEEIIDTGLARLYQAHLEVASRIAEAQGVSLTTTLLTGRAPDEVLAYAERSNPWLLLLGRIGVHSSEDMDMGSVTEQMLRLGSCNLLVASRRYSPSLEMWSGSSVRWTEEGKGVLERAPEAFRGALRLLVQRIALERGHSVVTASLVREAMESLRPSKEDTRRVGQAALSVAIEALGEQAVTVHLCRRCGHAARGQEPVTCPVCQDESEGFLEVKPETLETMARGQGGVEEEETFDGRRLRWAREALERLKGIPDAGRRSRARLRVEKEARYRKLPVITLEFVLCQLQGTQATEREPGRQPHQ